MAGRLLICGAFEPEVDHLTSLNRKKIQIPGMTGPSEVHVCTTGIGSAAAASTVAGEAAAGDLTAVLFLGSCGLYLSKDAYERLPENTVADISWTMNIPVSSLMPDFHLPQPMRKCVRVNVDLFKSRELNGFFTGLTRQLNSRLNLIDTVCNTTDVVTLKETDPLSLFNEVDHTGSGEKEEYINLPVVENLELAGIAESARRHNIVLKALLAVTNRVCEEGSFAWKNNFRSRSDRLQRAVHDSIANYLT